MADSNIAKAILKKKISGELKTIFLQTNTDNVVLVENGVQKTLATKITEIITRMDGMETAESIQASIKAEIAAIVDGAPEAFDTLKELAEGVANNKTLADTLNEAITTKVSKEDGKSLVLDTLIDEITALNYEVINTITAEKIANWDIAQKNVIETVNVNGEALTPTNKIVDISVPVITVGTTEPVAMKEGDLFFHIIEDSTEGTEGTPAE